MLQYLLNTTAIWALSLLAFDLFLKKESFHNYNRVYLLFTFLLGVFLPLYSWETPASVRSSAFNEPIEQIVVTKSNIVAKATPAPSLTLENFIWYLYLAGVVIALFLLIAEVVKLLRLYGDAKSYKDGSWKIVETGKEHSPFSILHFVFVGTKDAYTETEWQTILKHEQAHGKLLHFADVLIMQLSKAVFWFNPLVYMYERRLLMIHEYQADKAATEKPKEYGNFLIEQAMLQHAPQITHSFNRSPIKKRITMLTHRSSRYKHVAKLLVLPMMAVFLVCCTRSMYNAGETPIKNGAVATYKGNTIRFSAPLPDTIMLTNPATGEQTLRIVRLDSLPVTLNNEAVVKVDELASEPVFERDGGLRSYLLHKMQPELSKLPDGNYIFSLNYLLINKEGHVAYYNYGGIAEGIMPGTAAANGRKLTNGVDTFVVDEPNKVHVLNKNDKDNIDKALAMAMSGVPAFVPARSKEGNLAVPTLYQDANMSAVFEVKNHQLLDLDGKTKGFKQLSGE